LTELRIWKLIKN